MGDTVYNLLMAFYWAEPGDIFYTPQYPSPDGPNTPNGALRGRTMSSPGIQSESCYTIYFAVNLGQYIIKKIVLSFS